MRKLIALGLCAVFILSFSIGIMAESQEPSIKVLRDCEIVGNNQMAVMCCVVEDHETQTSYEECYFIYFSM